jgi:hypothetical protein
MGKGSPRERRGSRRPTAAAPAGRRPAARGDEPGFSLRAVLTALLMLALLGAGTYLAFGAGDAGEEELKAGADQPRVPWVDRRASVRSSGRWT